MEGKVHIEAKTFSELVKGDKFFCKMHDSEEIKEYEFDRVEKLQSGVHNLYYTHCCFFEIGSLDECIDDRYGGKVSTNKYLLY